MAIPRSIKRKHVLQAIKYLSDHPVPARRQSQKFVLIHNDKEYPPKYIVSLAAKCATGKELDPEEHSGGSEANDFLLGLGFDIKKRKPAQTASARSQNKQPVKSRQQTRSGQNQKHTENCAECKKRIEELLIASFGETQKDHKVQFPSPITALDGTTYGEHLQNIYKSLCQYRGHRSFGRSDSLRCDYYVCDPGFIVEFDESQHFTEARKRALSEYPPDLVLGFDTVNWIQKCAELDRHDNNPADRDETRAWYDTLRDFLPLLKDFKPTIRLFASDRKWCELDAATPEDLKLFQTTYFPHVTPTIEVLEDGKVSQFARLIIDGPWSGSLVEARALISKLCSNWHGHQSVECIITCGGFLRLNMPQEILDRETKNSELQLFQQLAKLTRQKCEELLYPELRTRLATFTSYITLGVDFGDVSPKKWNKRPHCELVAIVNLESMHIEITGKSYPTSEQQRTLILCDNPSSHIMDLPWGKTLVLGCHDLTAFNRRSDATARNPMRLELKREMKHLLNSEKPTHVFQHPHITVKKKSWQDPIGVMKAQRPPVRFMSAGRYEPKNHLERQKHPLDAVLRQTHFMPTLDFIVHTDVGVLVRATDRQLTNSRGNDSF